MLPLVRWCLQLIVTMPLVAPLPLLLLSMINHLLPANASPPVSLLFASWLLCHPCCCAAAASRPLDMPPLSLILLTRHLRLKTSHLRLATCRCLLSAGTSPLVCLSFACWLSHHISSRCFCLLSSCQHRHLLMRWQLTSHSPLVCLSFASTGCLCV